MNETSVLEPNSEARNWAVACHLSAFFGLLTAGIGAVLGPLVVWLVKKDEHPFVSDQGKEAVNFQLTMLIGSFVCALLMLVLIGFVLLGLLILFDLICVINAAIKASEGVAYRYPLNLRLIK